MVAEVAVGSGAALVTVASPTSSKSQTLPLQKARSDSRHLSAAVILDGRIWNEMPSLPLPTAPAGATWPARPASMQLALFDE